MKYNQEDILKLFNNNNNPIFLCDENLNVTYINNYIIKNSININKSDNLFIHSLINCNELVEGLCKLNKGLPFHSTTFLFNLRESSISFYPIFNNQNKLDTIVCCLELNSNKNINEKTLPRCICESFKDPTIRILNIIPIIAHKLDLLEQYEELKCLNNITNNCYKMLKTSISTNEYYKLVNNKVDFNFRPIILNNYLDDLMKALQVMLVDSGYKLEYNLCDDIIISNFDDEYLSMALFCIISNSCIFSPKDSTIKIVLRLNNGYANITITDEGVGIKQENIDQIFNPFFTYSENVQSKEPQGLGLGLPTSKKIVEAMGGNIFVKSEVNCGTTIALSFPVLDDVDLDLAVKSNNKKYISNQFSYMHIYFSEICNVTIY